MDVGLDVVCESILDTDTDAAAAAAVAQSSHQHFFFYYRTRDFSRPRTFSMRSG